MQKGGVIEIKNILRRIKNAIYLSFYYFYDFLLFIISNRTNTSNISKKLLASIKINLHKIEKGLSYDQPKVNFGTNIIDELIKDSVDYYKLNGATSALDAVYDAISEYSEKKITNEKITISRINTFLSSYTKNNNKVSGGTKKYNLSISNSDSKVFGNIVKSRMSCRSFSKDIISAEIINNSLQLASFSPSVCNRQTCKTYSVPYELIPEALKLQKGTRGFSKNIHNLLVITSDLNYYNGYSEYNQCFFEMGTFAMNLVYGFHLQNVSTLYLNWCASPINDIKLKRILNIPNNFRIGVLIAFGYPSTQVTAFSNKTHE